MKKQISGTYEEIMESIIGYMIEYRKRIGMTQQQLADKSGVAQPVIARIEKKKTDPQMSTFCKLLNSLGIKLQPKKEITEVEKKLLFAYGICQLDGPAPDQKIINIGRLFLNHEIDYETAKFAIGRLVDAK